MATIFAPSFSSIPSRPFTTQPGTAKVISKTIRPHHHHEVTIGRHDPVTGNTRRTGNGSCPLRVVDGPTPHFRSSDSSGKAVDWGFGRTTPGWRKPLTTKAFRMTTMTILSLDRGSQFCHTRGPRAVMGIVGSEMAAALKCINRK